jgi:ABC-type transporter Mla subunit MlaD
MGKAFKKIKRFFTTKNHKYINGTKGIISIFLACMLVPVAYLTDMMIESGRYNQATSVAEQAVANAETSTLSEYDEYMLERFGFASVNQKNPVKDTVNKYLEMNYKDNVHTAKIKVNSAKGKLPLDNDDVLMRQIEESSKYSLPAYYAGGTINALLKKIKSFKLTKMFDKFIKIFGNVGKVADSVVQFASKVEKLHDTVEVLEGKIKNYKDMHNNFVSAVNNLAKAKKDLESAMSDLNKKERDSSGSSQALSECNKVFDDIINKINDLNTDNDKKTELISKIEAIKGKPGKNKLYTELKDFAKENFGKNDKITLSDGSVVKIRSLSDKIKSLDYKNVLDKAGKASKALNEARSNVENIRAQIQPQINKFNNAKTSYISSLNDLVADANTDGSIKKFASDFNELMSAADGLKSTAESITKEYAFDIAQGLDDDLSSMKKEKEEYEKELKDTTDAGRKEELNALIKEYDYMVDDQEKIYSNMEIGVGKVNDFASEIFEDVNAKNLLGTPFQDMSNKAVNQLNSVLSKVKQMDEDDIGSWTSISGSNTNYYHNLSNSFNAKNLIVSFAENLWKTITNFKGILKKIKAAFGTLETMYKNGGFYNKNLTSTIKEDPYSQSGFDNVIIKMADFAEALNNFKVEKKKGFLGKAIAIIKSVVNFVKNLKNLIKSGIELVKAIKNFIGEMLTNLSQNINDLTSGKIGKRLLMSLYAINSLPNRTNYDSGKSAITGIKYSDIARNDTSEDLVVPLYKQFKDVKNLVSKLKNSKGADNVFSGAELEYMLIGSRSEVFNQMGSFFQIYFLRFLINIPTVMADSFVQSIAEAAGSCTFGIGTAIVYIIYLLAEPYLDTNFLALGKTLSIIKSKLYLTPEGLPDLLKELNLFDMPKSMKDDLKEKGKEITGKNSTANPVTAADKADVDKSGNGAKSIMSAIKASYTTYLFLFIFLENSMQTNFNRYKTLVNIEGKEYYRSQKIDFKLQNAFTNVTVDATSEFSPILPLEPMSYAAFHTVNVKLNRGY